MRILHLSDFHFKSLEKDKASQTLLIDKLILNLQDSNLRVDFIIFSGDLVFSGEEEIHFKDAYTSFLEEIGLVLKISKRNIIICPGNHDVDRKAVSEPVKDYIRKIDNSDLLNKLIEDNKEDIFGVSLKPTSNYFSFEKSFYSLGESLGIDTITPLTSIHIRDFGNKKIGFVSINTAWCSSGNDDKGNLFFPKSELEKAISYLNQNNVFWKILVLHHPLSDLREFNKVAIEDFIYSEFHFMFSGHLHKREDFIRLTQNEGIFGTYAHAAFTKKEDGKIGYSIVDIQLDTLEVRLSKFIYDHEEGVFLSLKELLFDFPCNEIKSNQIKLFKTLKKRLVETIDEADELCITTKDHNLQKGFLDLFVNPVIKKEPQIENINNFQTKKIEYSTLLNDKNFLILGKDKTGKTSLLYKLNIDLLLNFSQLGRIPFYVDLSFYKTNSQKFDMISMISTFIEHPKSATIQILKSYKVKLMLDNFDPSKNDITLKISKFLKDFPNCNYIILCDQTLAQSYEILNYGFDGYEKLFIHDISRTEIRQLTNKWPGLPQDKRDEFVERIIEVLKQHSMPFNFWTLSIFLWIFSGKSTLNFNSNSELLELYIDDILDRNQLASNPQNRFSYTNYKLLLSELAYELLTKHLDTNHSMKFSDLIKFTEGFKEKNIKRVGLTSDIVNHLIERGVLKMMDNDYITFRLNGVFEYFIAFDFIENNKFLNEILNDDKLYLSFKNEFEIYSGFQRTERENEAFLNRVFKKTKTAFFELNSRIEGDIDLRLTNGLNNDEILNLIEPIKELVTNDKISPLSNDEKDELMESINIGLLGNNVEVKPKKLYDVSVKKFDILERFLLINGRVFKNIENITNSEFIDEVFDFIIDSASNLGLLLIEEMEKDLNEKNKKELDSSNTNKIILDIVSNYLPNVVQGFINDAIGHINLEGIILKKIDSLKQNLRTNQFKLFLLYSLLLDIDLKRYKHLIDEMIENAKIGIIKSSLLMKLSVLLLMKSYEDDKMINFLKEKLRLLSIQINPKTDMRQFDINFEKTRKLILIKRQIP